ALSCHHLVGHSKGTAGYKPEEGGDDVKSSWPLRAGLHTCYNGGDRGTQWSNPAQISKSRLSSDWSLQFDSMNSESLVIVVPNAASSSVLETIVGMRHRPR